MKLSIVVPVYNSEKYLKDMIRSIQGQSIGDFELILVDDGSKDSSGIICDEEARKDNRIKVIHKENGGQSSARNAGLDIATGEYIAFADNDDAIHPRMYEWLISSMEESGSSVGIGGFSNVPDSSFDERDIAQCHSSMAVINEREWISDFFKPTWKIPVWNKVYRREILEGLRFSDYHLGEDNLFSYRVIKRARKAAYIPEVLYFQRMHGNNFEFTGSRYYIDLIKAKERILNDIKETFPYEYRNAQKAFIYECIRVYNAYIDMDVDRFKEERKGILDILKMNCSNLFLLDMPIGHKLLLRKIKKCDSDNMNTKIVI